ncbi:hypothetical protein BE04_32620 [Sorangium cellulosum]|uniref:Uncharacterized protein n=2 Tax=Sorangium cellulosum TaxID=56 RepID=A0A150Q3R5_SORCE|nr:hypothetical protein [Sorangium cellulosum]AGP37275.1 hypothetical protein SCE1572_24005 [Sorangium cellulosum So0157-2]KYF62622.1 hypothetical protein BE04_32620 [Sorangium cellulosum]KYG04026.1 hypothetical protein BE21_48965 [Sorangium cellulosum]
MAILARRASPEAPPRQRGAIQGRHERDERVHRAGLDEGAVGDRDAELVLQGDEQHQRRGQADAHRREQIGVRR